MQGVRVRLREEGEGAVTRLPGGMGSMPMTTREALHRAILENPDEDDVRLRYADLLQEEGEGDRAEFVRVQCELASRDGCRNCSRLTVAARAFNMSAPVRYCPKCVHLRRRERELFHLLDFPILGHDKPLHALRLTPDELDRCELLRKGLVSRGFVSEVRLPAAAFTEEVARALFSRHPIAKVVLSDKKPDLYHFSGVRRDERPNPSFDWWDGEVFDADEPDNIPNHLYLIMARQHPLLVKDDWIEFSARDAAIAALSDACVLWGRELAGLSPLPLSCASSA